MYRDFAQRKARGLKLVGEVQNIPDGTVRVVAEGPRDALDAYLAKLHKGPLLAHVETVEPRWLAATGEFVRFDIVYA